MGTATFERVHGSSYAALSDSALAGLVAAGDGRAFEVVFTRFKDVLFKYSWTITGNREDAEEAVQTAMVNAYRALGEGSAPQAIALRPWLFRITHNASVTIIRARRPEAPLRDGVEPPYPGAAPHERVEGRERLRGLLADIAALPERQRAALMMREVGGLSHALIAGALGTSAEEVRRLVHDARIALSESEAGRDEACRDVRQRIATGDGRVLRGRRVSAHLRACEPCALFADAERGRRRRLAAWLPVFPVVAATAVAKTITGAAGGTVFVAGSAGAGIGAGAGGGTGGGPARPGPALAAGLAAVGLVLAFGLLLAVDPFGDSGGGDLAVAPQVPSATGGPASGGGPGGGAGVPASPSPRTAGTVEGGPAGAPASSSRARLVPTGFRAPGGAGDGGGAGAGPGSGGTPAPKPRPRPKPKPKPKPEPTPTTTPAVPAPPAAADPGPPTPSAPADAGGGSAGTPPTQDPGTGTGGGDNPYTGGDNPYTGGDNPYTGGDNPYTGGDNPDTGGDPSPAAPVDPPTGPATQGGATQPADGGNNGNAGPAGLCPGNSVIDLLVCPIDPIAFDPPGPPPVDLQIAGVGDPGVSVIRRSEPASLSAPVPQATPARPGSASAGGVAPPPAPPEPGVPLLEPDTPPVEPDTPPEPTPAPRPARALPPPAAAPDAPPAAPRRVAPARPASARVPEPPPLRGPSGPPAGPDGVPGG